MSLHKEISFEDEICEHLAGQDWLYADTDSLTDAELELIASSANDGSDTLEEFSFVLAPFARDVLQARRST